MLSKRITSGIIGGVLAIAVLTFNKSFPMLINSIISLITILSMSEIFSVMGISNLFCITIPTSIFVAMMPMFGYGLLWQLSWFLFTLIIFVILILNQTLKLKDISIIYTMSILLTLSLSKLVELRDFDKQYGSFYVLLALGTAWMSDTGAYFFGKKFGKYKLCPNVSPKKTIEGVVGGILCCILSLIFIGFLFNNFIFPEKYKINYFLLIIMGLIGSPISVIGDLFFSVVKRNCHVKDFGNAIPGHGGILDRFDSLIFVAPYTYLFIKFIPIIT